MRLVRTASIQIALTPCCRIPLVRSLVYLWPCHVWVCLVSLAAGFSMQRASTSGLVPDNKCTRCNVVGIYNADTKNAKEMLYSIWARASVQVAHDKLAKDDVSVTNQKDKDQQLPKMKEIDEKVRQFWVAANRRRTSSVSSHSTSGRFSLRRTARSSSRESSKTAPSSSGVSSKKAPSSGRTPESPRSPGTGGLHTSSL